MSMAQHVREALMARAAALGIRAESEEATVDALLEREVVVAPPTAAQCRDYYDTHRDSLRPGSIAEVDHILFAVTDPVPAPALRERAEQVLAALQADDRGFAATARAVSNCPSAEVGGNLGQLTQADVVPEFWRAIVEHGIHHRDEHATADDRSRVLPHLVATRFGLHIVRLKRMIAGDVLPFDLARPQIEEQLAERHLRVALHEYVHSLVHVDADASPAHHHDHEHDHAYAQVHVCEHRRLSAASAPEPVAAGSAAASNWAMSVHRFTSDRPHGELASGAPAPSAAGGCGGGGSCTCAGT